MIAAITAAAADAAIHRGAPGGRGDLTGRSSTALASMIASRARGVARSCNRHDVVVPTGSSPLISSSARCRSAAPRLPGSGRRRHPDAQPAVPGPAPADPPLAAQPIAGPRQTGPHCAGPDPDNGRDLGRRQTLQLVSINNWRSVGSTLRVPLPVSTCRPQHSRTDSRRSFAAPRPPRPERSTRQRHGRDSRAPRRATPFNHRRAPAHPEHRRDGARRREPSPRRRRRRRPATRCGAARMNSEPTLRVVQPPESGLVGHGWRLLTMNTCPARRPTLHTADSACGVRQLLGKITQGFPSLAARSALPGWDSVRQHSPRSRLVG